MSKKFRRFYETAFDSKISKSDDDLLSADKHDAVIAHRLSSQLQLSASASSVHLQQLCNDDDDDDDDDDAVSSTAGGGGRGVVRSSSSAKLSCKTRLFGFLQSHRRRISAAAGGRFKSCNKYRSSDSVATSSSLSLESITSDSMSSHSSESPRCYKRFPEPHVLSPISDKSSQDAGAEMLDYERRRSSAATVQQVKTKPPQSLGLIKLNRDQQQHHGSDSGISVGSKPGGDNYQELLDVPFDMPKLRRKQKSEVFRAEVPAAAALPSTAGVHHQPPELPFDMPKLRRKQVQANPDSDVAVTLPFDMPKLRKRQMDSCARIMSLDFDIGSAADAYSSSDTKNRCDDNAAACSGPNKSEQLKELPFDIPKLKKINLHNGGDNNRLDRSSLFLNVKPNKCTGAAVNTNNAPSLKTFQNKNQPNRPTLSLSNIKPLNFVEDIDVSLPLDQQCWYHGPMNRLEAEKALHGQGEGSYLVRGNKGSYALSIKSAKGFIHMRITQSEERNYLGQSDRPFESIPDLIRHYTLNKLPAKGAEHVGLIRPLAHQIL
ncbi:SH2 domain [Cinara cedri]|uniref:SH2 domain n=1 Tax=Cinara cedri TaxID=506608 RepID=A0A5E4M4Q8_9HEMI|nr:SH2 domain [Cinara cedri]